MQHIVSFSSGVASYLAAKRVAEKHGTDSLILLFADTKSEDFDNYRFLREAANDVGGQLVTVTEGRDVWQVFFDERFLGNSKKDICSRILKRELLDAFRADFNPETTILYNGIDWTESHRYYEKRDLFLPFRLEAPLCEAPFLSKKQMLDITRANGIEPPRLYDLKFSHANCGGFCVKAGQAHFANLFYKLPDVYAYHENKEQQWRAETGHDRGILRIQRNKKRFFVTLKEFRENYIERNDYDKFDWGGCGCTG